MFLLLYLVSKLAPNGEYSLIQALIVEDLLQLTSLPQLLSQISSLLISDLPQEVPFRKTEQVMLVLLLFLDFSSLLGDLLALFADLS